MGVNVSNTLSAGSTVEADADCVVVYSLVTKNVLAPRQINRSNFEWCLSDEEVRILSFRRVAGGDHYHASDESAAIISYSGGRAKLRFNVLFDHRRTDRDKFP